MSTTGIIIGVAGCSSETDTTSGWRRVESPTEKTLYSVVQSTKGPYAVGEGGKVLAERRDGWVVVVKHGPTGEGNTLRGTAVSDDGRHVWFAGGSGVLGVYDVVNRQMTDYSAPKEKTSTWEDIAVTGSAGGEHIYLINGSGELLQGENDGGKVNWGTVIKPGGGSSMKGIAFVDEGIGYICDTNAKVYETLNGGDKWSTIGIEGGSVGLYDVAPVSPDRINVAGGSGSVFRYNGFTWTRLKLGENTINAIDRTKDGGLAAGGGGSIYRLTDNWQVEPTPTTNTLHGIIVGTEDFSETAIGGSGTILQRSRNDGFLS
ncbi:WD40/YVTN/BNR-like repeat-containing protein [Haladaptatus halobius]|uniref:WD40/YVTN/BNR-like repeat-containing protein n=1 Tax=Haladaptatus halobius TaxID=2884875 RepID=UPI001D0AFBC0|nr:hypothetical protein [Haladaptatus halobius]